MKIYIKENNKLPISFTIPNSLLFCKFTKRIISYSIKTNATQVPDIDYKQIDILMDSIKNYIKEYGSFDLVDIESNDGTTIKISF